MGIKSIKHLNLVLKVEEIDVVMSTADMVDISLASCGKLVDNVSDKRNEIIDVLYFLVNGLKKRYLCLKNRF